MELIIVLIVGLVVGYKISTAMHLQAIKDLLRSLDISNEDLMRAARKNASAEMLLELDAIEQRYQQQKSEETVIDVKLEQHGGQIYAFRKDTDQFIGQGADTAALIERLNQTLKPCRVVVAKEDGADLLQKNNG